MSELVRVVRNDRERPVYHKDLLPVVYVVADQAGRTDSPLYGMFAARGKVAGQRRSTTAARSASTSSASPPTRTGSTR